MEERRRVPVADFAMVEKGEEDKGIKPTKVGFITASDPELETSVRKN